jgi:hypothetical protein
MKTADAAASNIAIRSKRWNVCAMKLLRAALFDVRKSAVLFKRNPLS